MDTGTKARFVMQHKEGLIQKVPTVMAIVDSLNKVHHEDYAKIRAEKTTMAQMRLLYQTTLDPGGTSIRAAFYDALVKHQPHLLENLDVLKRSGPGAGGGAHEEELDGVFHPFDLDGARDWWSCLCHAPEPLPRKRCAYLAVGLSVFVTVVVIVCASVFGPKPPGPTPAPGPPDIDPPKPGSTDRQDYKKHSCQIEMDENTANADLFLSEDNRKVTNDGAQPIDHYPPHPYRFGLNSQVLSRESLSERCYFEVKWHGWLGVAVSYIDINRDEKVYGDFGNNEASWMLGWSDVSDDYWFKYNRDQKILSGPRPSKFLIFPIGDGVVGVYVDQKAGKVSFYQINGDRMMHIYTLVTTFTHPLYLGLYVGATSRAEVLNIW